MKGILRKLHKYPVCITESLDQNDEKRILSGNDNYDKICSMSGKISSKIVFVNTKC